MASDGDSHGHAPSGDSPTLPPLFSAGKAKALSDAEVEKLKCIREACEERDVAALREHAGSKHGLVQDDARRRAWPLLLGYDAGNQAANEDWRDMDRHRDEGQVQLDVDRSFVYYPHDESDARITARKGELSDLIIAVLRRHPELCYFQGYHDIVQVFLLVLGADAAGPAVARLSLLRIRDFMLPTLAPSEAHLQLLPSILYVADAKLCQHLVEATRPTPFFALAATLTLYAHDIEEYGDIARLYDFLLASEAAIPVYLFAVIVMSRKKELLEIDSDEPEMLHSILSKLPKPLDLEGLIQRTRALYRDHPPEKLPNRIWRRISHDSVLKTTRGASLVAEQTLQDGEVLFAKQKAETEREEAWKQLRVSLSTRMRTLVTRYKRPAALTWVAVAVALTAYYFGRDSSGAVPSNWMMLVSNMQAKSLQLVQRLLAR